MQDLPSVVIQGTGRFLPERVVDNKAIEKIINTSDEFIVKRTGVLERRHADAGQSLSDLIVPAARKAIEDAGLDATDIDLLICNTLSPDYHDPSQACLIQPLLGLRHVPVFDIRAQCSGLLYGIDIARQYIQTGRAKHALVVCAEMLSKRMDVSDAGRNLSILLGDGAGALVLSRAEDSTGGFIDVVLGADGDYFELLHTRSPGTRNAAFMSEDDIAAGHHQFRMQGRPMFEHATASLIAVAKQILERNNLSLDDIDLIVPHQPNLRILDAVRDGLGVPEDKLMINVDRLGNMASASLPVALDMARDTGRMPANKLCMILGYGAGATWGAALYRS
jgi:3-oxoacyl-[acyl-carrier-protein] synthase III